ncbi:MAG: aldehyde dehydrogenase family protein [Planctomycetes bacterium]|nr:aldehyde dehydrogenase family protein [Planctomycetota bacterium]
MMDSLRDDDLRSIQEARALVGRAKKAQAILDGFTQEQVDRIVDAMAEAGDRAAESLARLAVEETGYGKVDSKIAKNQFVTREHYRFVRQLRTVGVISRDETSGVYELAEPVGVIAGIIPVTNPTSTALFKAMIAIKARNAIVLSPHPRAVRCITESARVLAEAAVRAGAPDGAITCMTVSTIEGTTELMKHPDTALILATGGPGLVKAAYSAGKPAFGVGPGNVPAFIERTADVPVAARTICESQSFDWGTLCCSEQSLILDAPIRDRALAEMTKHGAHVCDEDETRKLEAVVSRDGKLHTAIVGQSPAKIAKMAGFTVPESTQVLVAEGRGVGPKFPLSLEKLAPVLSMYTVDGWREGCERCLEVLRYGGMGHTLVIHSRDPQVVYEFFLKKPAFRLLVNAPASQGAVGLATRLRPSMTLGCGTAGGNITSDNITPLNLINVKRLAFVTDEYSHGSNLRFPLPVEGRAPAPMTMSKPAAAVPPAPTPIATASAGPVTPGFRPRFWQESATTAPSEPPHAASTTTTVVSPRRLEAILASGRKETGGDCPIGGCSHGGTCPIGYSS